LFALNGGQALIIAIAMTSMLALAAVHVSEDKMTLGDFVLINAFMMQLFMPLNFLGFVYREIKGSLANIENLFGLLDKSPKVQDCVDANELIVDQAEICFDNIHFAYNSKRPIIKGVSFKIKDNQDISKVTQHSLRQNIGIVPQDTVLFNDTLFANVNYGNPDASAAQVMHAIELAHLTKFVNSLPDGIETMVGERGLKLSGGEKQRVAIARTILKNPQILVFDEATSSLDSHSEQAILRAINDVTKNRTSLVIAHRLSTIIDSDNIIVMNDGEVVEQGSHQQLLALQGKYSKMWQLQQSIN